MEGEAEEPQARMFAWNGWPLAEFTGFITIVCIVIYQERIKQKVLAHGCTCLHIVRLPAAAEIRGMCPRLYKKVGLVLGHPLTHPPSFVNSDDHMWDSCPHTQVHSPAVCQPL